MFRPLLAAVQLDHHDVDQLLGQSLVEVGVRVLRHEYLVYRVGFLPDRLGQDDVDNLLLEGLGAAEELLDEGVVVVVLQLLGGSAVLRGDVHPHSSLLPDGQVVDGLEDRLGCGLHAVLESV